MLRSMIKNKTSSHEQESGSNKSKFTMIRKNLILQSRQLIDDSLKNKSSLDKDELLKQCLPSFLKTTKQKDVKDIALISLYLVQMKKFMKLFGEDFTSVKDIGYFEQLKKIASTIIYQKYNKNRIVVKFGDEGKKFFLILKGEVQVVLPNKRNIILRQKEFKRYLLLLYIYKEFEILKLVIKENKVNQAKGIFNNGYYFFQDEINANNNNEQNQNKEEENKANMNNNNNYGFKDYKLGFNKIENKKDGNLMNDNINEKNKFKEMKKARFLKKLMRYYLTDEEIAFYEKTKNINTKEVDDDIKVTPIDYINRIMDFSSIILKPLEDETDDDLFVNDDLKASYFIYEYKKLIELQTGDIFGDLALTKNNIKRTATIISIDECHFACLTRELYSAFIEKGNERIRNNKINYLCSINILKNYPRFILEKKLFNNFGFKNFIKDKYILKSNEINNNIIFLKDGIFEVSFSGKLNDLSNLINLFYKEYNNLANKKEREELGENLVNNVKLLKPQKYKIERLFQRDINEEFSYILFLVNAPSIFGFRETETKISKIIINEKKKTKEKIHEYISNICVKCNSSKGEYIYIDKNIFYKYIYGTDSTVQDETKNYVLDFLRKLIKRLLNIRYIKLWNLFLSIGVDKSYNSNINFEKMEFKEDIYKTVNKLLSILKEGQLYSNEISKYIGNYFESKRKLNQNQKQKIKLVSQRYQSDKLKKIIKFVQNSDLKINKNLDYFSNRAEINSKNSNYLTNTINNISNKNSNKYNLIPKKLILNNNINQYKLRVQKSSNELHFKGIRIKPKINNKRSISAVTITNLNKSESIPHKGTQNAKLVIKNNKKFNTIRRATSALSTAYSFINKNSNQNNFTIKLEHLSKPENNKINEMMLIKSNIYHKNKFIFSAHRPSTSKSSYYSSYFNYIRNSKEKYVRERINYVIKNTRMAFTKSKNLDKIVRIKRTNSVG